MLLQVNRDDDNLVDLIDTRIHLNWEVEKEELYWEYRAKANWLKSGDRNTAFFHRSTTKRRSMNLI